MQSGPGVIYGFLLQTPNPPHLSLTGEIDGVEKLFSEQTLVILRCVVQGKAGALNMPFLRW